jgi:hypothetical protein
VCSKARLRARRGFSIFKILLEWEHPLCFVMKSFRSSFFFQTTKRQHAHEEEEEEETSSSSSTTTTTTTRDEQTQRGSKERGAGVRGGHASDQHERDKISEEILVELTSGGDGLFGASTFFIENVVGKKQRWCKRVLGSDVRNVLREVPIGRNEERNGDG